MKKLVLGLSAAVAAVAGTGALCAAAPAGPASASAGPNDDRTITWAEAKAQADALWQRMDVNKDGKIDQADRDARVMQRFDAIDANHDGMISRDEFLAHHRDMKPGRGPMAGPDGAMPPPPPAPLATPPGADRREDGPLGPRADRPDMPPPAMGLLGPVLHDALRDKDGEVTRAGYDAMVKSQFDKADTNHDGKLTRDEIRAAFGHGGRPGWRHGDHKGGPRGRDGERRDGPPPPPPGGDDDMPPPPPAGN